MRYTIVSEVPFKPDVAVIGAQLQISVLECEREGTYLFKQNGTKLPCSKYIQR